MTFLNILMTFYIVQRPACFVLGGPYCSLLQMMLLPCSPLPQDKRHPQSPLGSLVTPLRPYQTYITIWTLSSGTLNCPSCTSTASKFVGCEVEKASVQASAQCEILWVCSYELWTHLHYIYKAAYRCSKLRNKSGELHTAPLGQVSKGLCMLLCGVRCCEYIYRSYKHININFSRPHTSAEDLGTNVVGCTEPNWIRWWREFKHGHAHFRMA